MDNGVETQLKILNNRMQTIAYVLFRIGAMFMLAFFPIFGIAKAHAQQLFRDSTCTKRCILPPAKYDKPYTGKLTIETVTPWELRKRCLAATAASLGCAFPSGDSCHIMLVDEKFIIEDGLTKEQMMRHEIGHCNGWPGDHPGIRRYDAKPGKAPLAPLEETVVDTRTRIPETFCPSGQVTEPCR